MDRGVEACLMVEGLFLWERRHVRLRLLHKEVGLYLVLRNQLVLIFQTSLLNCFVGTILFVSD